MSIDYFWLRDKNSSELRVGMRDGEHWHIPGWRDVFTQGIIEGEFDILTRIHYFLPIGQLTDDFFHMNPLDKWDALVNNRLVELHQSFMDSMRECLVKHRDAMLWITRENMKHQGEARTLLRLLSAYMRLVEKNLGATLVGRHLEADETIPVEDKKKLRYLSEIISRDLEPGLNEFERMTNEESSNAAGDGDVLPKEKEKGPT